MRGASRPGEAGPGKARSFSGNGMHRSSSLRPARKASPGAPWLGQARPGEVRPVRSRRRPARQGKELYRVNGILPGSGPGHPRTVWRGRAWQGAAMPGESWRCVVRPGMARRGIHKTDWTAPGFEPLAVTQGRAMRGDAWQCKARQGHQQEEDAVDFRITISGTDALLMHNARLSNPLDPAAKAVKKLTGKRNKTDEDYEELARVEWTGGLYYDSEIGPYIPADNIWRCLFDAAKKHKKGPRIKEGVFIATSVNPLAYSGPRDEAALWADENYRHFASAKVGTQRVTRCRPMFRQWKTEADGMLDTALLDLSELQQIAEVAGSLIGLGDWRPRYGRFQAQVVKL